MPFAIALPIASKYPQGDGGGVAMGGDFTEIDIDDKYPGATALGGNFSEFSVPREFEGAIAMGGNAETYTIDFEFDGCTAMGGSSEDLEITSYLDGSLVMGGSADTEEITFYLEGSTAMGGSFETYDFDYDMAGAIAMGGEFNDFDAANTLDATIAMGGSGTGFSIDPDTQAYINAVSAAGDSVLDGAIASLDALIVTIKTLGLKPNVVLLLTFTDRAAGLDDSLSPTLIPIFTKNGRSQTGVNLTAANRVQAGLEFTGTEHILLGIPLSDTPFTNFTYHLQAVQTAVVQPSTTRWMLSNIHAVSARLDIQRFGFSSTTGQFRTIAGDTSGNAQFTSGTDTNPGTGVSVGYTLTAHTDTFNQSRLYTNGTLRYTSTMASNNATTGWAAATSTGRAVLGCRRSDNTSLDLHARFTAQVLLVMDVKLSGSEISTIQAAINTFVAATGT